MSTIAVRNAKNEIITQCHLYGGMELVGSDELAAGRELEAEGKVVLIQNGVWIASLKEDE